MSRDKQVAARGSDDVTLGDIEEQEMWEEHTRERVKQMQEASSAATPSREALDRFETWLRTQPWWMRFLAYFSGVLDD